MTTKKKTILLGLDSFDWQILQPLIDEGRLPHFARMAKEGATGNLTTLNPTISPILWNSIATGKRANKHGIHGFTEVDTATEKVRPVSSLSRKAKAIWNILIENGYTCHVLNWFASHPAEPLNGSCVTDLFTDGVTGLDEPWRLIPESVYPPEFEEELKALRIRINEIPGSLVQFLVPQGHKVDQKTDKNLHIIATELAKAFSIHSAATWILEKQEWDFLAVYWRTPDLLKHHFMPFYSLPLKGVNEEGFAIYKDVISGVYQLFDLMLGRYFELIPQDTTVFVISDHGFQSGQQRPAFHENPFKNPEAWHREQGVFLAKGPKITPGSTTMGARLLDVAPTLLTLNDVNPAFDMDGRVLTEIFKTSPSIAPIQSWESTGAESGQHPTGKDYSFPDGEKLVQQFVDLGYIEPLDSNLEKAAEQTRLHNKHNLARDLLDSGQAGVALPLLEDLHQDFPQSVSISEQLAQAQRAVGLLSEAEDTINQICQTIKERALLEILKAQIAIDKKDYQKGIGILQKLAHNEPEKADIQSILGRTYNLIGEYQAAADCFNNVLKTNPEDARAYQGLSFVALRKRHFTEALDFALKTISIKPDLHYAHVYLGMAAERLGCKKEAIKAFQNALNYGPRNRKVHRILVRLLTREGEVELAKRHHSLAIKIAEQNSQENERIIKLRKEVKARYEERKSKAIKSASYKNKKIEIEGTGVPLPISESLNLLIVSGIPRSGTSLMMQVLSAGGLKPLVDDMRLADTSNPEGYFEYEPIKRLRQNPRVIEEGKEKITKVISMLLPFLPKQHRYQIIYMRRDPVQVAKSQAKMIEKLHSKPAFLDVNSVAERLVMHDQDTLNLLKESDNIEFIAIQYEDLIRAPEECIKGVQNFLQNPLKCSAFELSKIVKPELWREKS